VRWLAAGIAGIAAAAAAQSLDLRYKPTTEGTVTALRTVDMTATTAPPAGGQNPGSPSDVSPGIPVGAVAVLPLGKDADKTWRMGAAGAPEMQPYLRQTAQEVVVTMDDGEKRVFRPAEPSRFNVGQRVSVRAGELAPASMRKDGS
jgi:hypothetical protein